MSMEPGTAAERRSPSLDNQVWLVTGASSGLGRALAEAVLARGGSVVATARDPDTLAPLSRAAPGRVLPVRLDVTNPDEVESCVAQALAWRGHVDVLVNNAGFGTIGATEEVDEAAIRAAFDTNFLGVHRMILAALPAMRERGRGHIINVSSMLGHVGLPGYSIYCAVKFAVEGLSEALAREVAPFGVGVTVVAPGPFRTDFRSRSMQAVPPRAPYDRTLKAFRESLLATDGQQPGDPRRAGDVIVDAVTSAQPPLHLILGEIAMTQVRAKAAALEADIRRFEEPSRATAFPT